MSVHTAVLGGADVIVFAGGIGENSKLVRSAVCQNMEWAGIELDQGRNRQVSGRRRSRLIPAGYNWSRSTNEEIGGTAVSEI
ncbi:MAG: hypothetical protein U0903_15250 [Planctomycetales bacterium]